MLQSLGISSGMIFRSHAADKKDDNLEFASADNDGDHHQDVGIMNSKTSKPQDPSSESVSVEMMDLEAESLLEKKSPTSLSHSYSKEPHSKSSKTSSICSPALFVLILLAVQNCSKNLLMRFVMKDQPKFLTSAAVLGSESIKLTLSVLYILLVLRKSPLSIIKFLRADQRNTLLLSVPASAYNLQMSLEYVALANINAAMFSVLVQSKLLFTATFAAIVLGKKLKRIQVVSLVLLTCGVMLCNLDKGGSSGGEDRGNATKGILATLGIALSSGFASVYTEKVIKGGGTVVKPLDEDGNEYGLAYTQVQLALMSLVTIGIWAIMTDFHTIVEYGLFYNFSFGAV
jgi:solute carrier family 35 (UDP-sugar transporter), member A1/2/3